MKNFKRCPFCGAMITTTHFNYHLATMHQEEEYNADEMVYDNEDEDGLD